MNVHGTGHRASLLFILAALAAVTAMVTATSVASAQGAATAAPAPSSPSSVGEVGLGLGFGQLDEDFFALVNLSFGMQLTVPKLACHGFFPPGPPPEGVPCTTSLKFGFGVPLRFRVIDRAPDNPEVLRKEDWDEASDYLRVLRFVEYGNPREPIYGRLGELSGVVIGHGTAMNGYYNTIDVDHHQFGMHTLLNSRFGGLELLLDNFARPEVLGYRAYVTPAQFFAPTSFWTRYNLGTTLLLDIDAPERFERVDVSVDPNLPLKVDETRNLIKEKSSVTGVFGLDHELLLVQDEIIDFIPFFDTNLHLDGSLGLHLGAFTNVRPVDTFHAYTRFELRWLGNQYIPDYFSGLYEIERNAYFGFGGDGRPKLAVLKDLQQGNVGGVYGEITLKIYRFLQLTGAYEDYQGPRNASILLRAQLADIGPVRLGGVYRRSGFNSFSDAFGLENALMIGEARYQINSWLYANGQYSRLYRLQPNGTFETVNDWNVGLGAGFTF